MSADTGAFSGNPCGPSRNTRQKKLILDCLSSAGRRHVTAEEIVDALKARGTPVAKSTIYRFLASLEESGEVRKYVLSDGFPACYQFIESHDSPCREHYHLMCRECGSIVHFESLELESAFREISSRGAGFLIDSVRTVFYGECGECALSRE